MNYPPAVLHSICNDMSVNELKNFIESSVNVHNACIQIYNQKMAIYRVQKFKYDLKQKILGNIDFYNLHVGKGILDLSDFQDDGSGIVFIPTKDITRIFREKGLKFVLGGNGKLAVVAPRYNEMADIINTSNPDD